MVDQKFAEDLRADHKRAHRCQCFSARMNRRKDALAAFETACRTSAFDSFHSDRMRFVDDEIHIELFAELDQIRQRGMIAFHAENTFDDDESLSCTRLTSHRVLEKIQIAMRKDDLLRSREANAIDQAGVISGVREHDVLAREY